MIHRLLERGLLIMPAALIMVVGSGLRATANPSAFFSSHLEQIRDSLPPDLLMRLPSELPSGGIVAGGGSQYRVQVNSSDTGLTVSLFNCESQVPACLVGSLVVNSQASTSTQELLQQHQAAAAPITLAKDVQGYFVEGSKQNPPGQFSSVMWEQDRLIYTVRFLAQERQSILYMAHSMANQTPIRSTAAAATQDNEPVVAAPRSFPRTQPVSLPADIFAHHLAEIQDSLPVGWSMRLPAEVLLRDSSGSEESQYQVRVLSSNTGFGLTVSIFSCEDDLYSCLVGSFSVDSEALEENQRRFQEHQAAAALITLAPGIQGYQLLEDFIPTPPSQFYSVMWEQDGLLYRVRFSAQERQNILWMAQSMANQTPIRSTAIAAAEPMVALTLDIAEPAAPTLAELPERIPVSQIKVTGSTIFGEDEFNPIIQPFEGKELTPEELREVADKITQLYLNEGYLTSRARPVSQTITEGVVEIRITEGSLVDIEIEGTQRLAQSYIRSRIELGAGTPLNINKLEDQLRLLRVDPLLDNIEATLQAKGEGQSILKVIVAEAEAFVANLSIDNYSPPSLGSERLGVSGRYRNVTGLGDEFSASYYRSTTGGSNVLDFNYRFPLNPMNGTLQFRAAPTWNEISESGFESLGIRGQNQLYEISYRQPLERTPSEEFALSLGFTFQDGQTFIFNDIGTPFGIGPDADGVSRTSVFKFGQDYISRDPSGAWSFKSQFGFGTGLFDATTNPSPIPDGHFFNWLGQAQRSQKLGDDHLLLIRGDLQLTPDSLLPAQQFVIGGGQSVRGFRQNARSGDNGFRFLIEDRITVRRNEAGAPTIQIAPFLDLGAVWNLPDNPNKLPDQTFLGGAGLGLLWDEFAEIEGLSLRLDYAIPFVDLSDRGTNVQDEGFYFNVNYQP